MILLLSVSKSVDAHNDQHNNENYDEQDDCNHPWEDLTVWIVLWAGTHIMVQFVVTDIGEHTRVTQALINVILTVHSLVSSSTITSVVGIKAVCPVGVQTREDTSGCRKKYRFLLIKEHRELIYLKF